jgi:hypothetical protein
MDNEDDVLKISFNETQACFENKTVSMMVVPKRQLNKRVIFLDDADLCLEAACA